MKLELKFKNINECNGVPSLRIKINNRIVWVGSVQPVITVDDSLDSGKVNLMIEHYGKENSDTVVENDQIIKDKNCELDEVIIDEYNIEELKWISHYVGQDQNKIDGCLFFGKNGYWHFDFELPILKWILETRHTINDNDPHWKEDYENFLHACKLINNLS
jgi:hypothetical protein